MKEGTNTFALCVCLCIAFNTSIYSQFLTPIVYEGVQSINDVEPLVRDSFIANDCFEVLNVRAAGAFNNNSNIGYFSNALAPLGMEAGIVLANCPLGSIQGGNSTTSAGADIGTGGDNDLNILVGVGTSTTDAAVIEFDFIPTATNVSFDYVFGSEEYCDFVGSVFNDVFGMFLSGPGIAGGRGFQNDAVNIATFTDPFGEELDVTINNVNNQTNTQFLFNNPPGAPVYIDNNIAATSGGGGECPIVDVANNPFTTTSQLDGWTTKFTASFEGLTICETYHIKIAIADGVDRIFGSAVYLQSNSFNAALGAGITDVVFEENGEIYAYEGCSEGLANIKFTRQPVDGIDGTVPLIIPVDLTGTSGINSGLVGAGTAVITLDYETSLPFLGSVSVLESPPTCETLQVTGDIVEGVNLNDVDIEVIDIIVQNPCFCEPEVRPLIIIDIPPLELEPLSGDTACFGQTTSFLTANVFGGFPVANQNFNDFLDLNSQNEFVMDIAPVPISTYNYAWTDIDGNSVGTEMIAELDLSEPGEYTFFLEVSDDCGSMLFDTIHFLRSGLPNAQLEGEFSICDESPDATLNLTIDGVPPLTLQYTLDGDTQSIVINNPDFEFIVSDPGEYEIIRIDGPNCGLDVSGIATVSPQSFLLDVTPTPTLCSDSEDGMLMANASQGSGNYTYLWSDGQTTQIATDLAPGMFTVTVTDTALGCTEELDGEVTAATSVSTISAELNGTTCGDPNSGEVMAEGSGGTGVFTYEWFANGSTPVGTGATLGGLPAGIYEVVATDENNCTATSSVTVNSDVNTPDAVAQNATIDCNNENDGIDVDVTGTSLGTEFSYTWTVNSGGGSIITVDGTPNAIISDPGSYTLTVINTINNCSADVTIVIDDARIDPMADAGSGFDCIEDAVQLGGPDLETGDDIIYEWTATSGGAIQGAIDVANPTVSEAGVYEVLVTNMVTGCTAISQTLVSIAPEVNIVDPTVIDCRGDGTVTLSGVGSETGTDITYNWTASNGGVISANGTTLNPSVSEAGTYTLVVANSATNCTSTMQIDVEDARGVLVADPGQALQINCNNLSVLLGGANTSVGDDVVYEWQIDIGGVITTANTENITAIAAGTYTLLVTDNSNGCTATDNITIGEDITLPTVSIDIPLELTCVTNDQILMSTGSSTNGDLTYTWTATAGGNIVSSQNDPNITIDDPGTYTLTIVNNVTGCMDSASVDVTEDADRPTVVIAAPLNIDCETTQVLLDGSGSDNEPGIEYIWRNDMGTVLGNTASIIVEDGGTYTLEVNNTLTGCSETDPIVVMDIRADPVAEAGDQQSLNCVATTVTLGGVGTSIGPDFTYAWTQVGGAFTSDEANPQISEGGDYILLVTNMTNGCMAEDMVNIPQDMIDPEIDVEISGVITCQEPIQTLMSDGSSTGAEFEYLWTGPDGFMSSEENPEITVSGDYELTILNTSNMCSVTDDVTVDEDAEFPEINIEEPDVVNCENMIIELSGDGSEVGPDVEYIWVASNGGVIEDDEDSLNPEISAEGTYTLTVSNTATGCSRTLEIQVTDDFVDPMAIVSPNLTFGCQDDILDVSGLGSSEGANITYEWSASPGNISGDTDTQSTQIDQPGMYTLLVTNLDNGCTAEESLLVTPDAALPDVAIELPEILTCDRSMITIDATGSAMENGLTLTWERDEVVFTPANNFMFDVEEPGVYTLTILDPNNGCISVQSIEVFEEMEPPVAEAGDGVILNCGEMMLNLDAGASSSGPEFTFAWTATNGGNIVADGDTDEPLVDEPGTYLLTITNIETGCTNTDEVAVQRDNVLPEIAIEDAMTLNCRDEIFALEATLSNQGSNFEFEWTEIGTANIESGEETLTPMIDEPGTYMLTVINMDNFCESSREIEVLQDIEEPDVAIATPDILNCIIFETELDGEAGSSQGDEFAYEWTSTSIGASFAGATDQINVMVNAPGIYELMVTNTTNFCANTFTITVDQNVDQPTAVTGPAQTVTCAISEAALSGAGSSVGPEFEYSWTALGTGAIVSGGTTLTPTVNGPGEYELTVLNTENGCMNISQQFVESNEIFPQATISTPVVLNCAVTEQILSVSGDAGLTFAWSSNGIGNIVGPTDEAQILVDAPGDYLLSVTNSLTGCTTSIMETVTEDIEPPNIEIAIPANLTCTESVTSLSGSGSSEGANFTYEWTTTGGSFMGSTTELEAFASSVGDYTLTIFNNENQCSIVESITVFAEGDVPTGINAESIDPACFGDSGGIAFSSVNGGVGPFEYSIDGGQTFSDDNIFIGLEPGLTYELLIRDVNGCTALETLNIPAVDSLTVNISEPFVELILGESFDITAFTTIPENEIATISWSPSEGLSCTDCLNPSVTPGFNIDYNVVVVSENGCVDEANIQFRVDRRIDIYIPNAFSPGNLDNVNDLFAPFGKATLMATVQEFQIYDRWGEQVFVDGDFALNTPNRGWKGDFRNEIIPGVYVYYIVLEFVDGSTELFEGDVTLVD